MEDLQHKLSHYYGQYWRNGVMPLFDFGGADFRIEVFCIKGPWVSIITSKTCAVLHDGASCFCVFLFVAEH